MANERLFSQKSGGIDPYVASTVRSWLARGLIEPREPGRAMRIPRARWSGCSGRAGREGDGQPGGQAGARARAEEAVVDSDDGGASPDEALRAMEPEAMETSAASGRRVCPPPDPKLAAAFTGLRQRLDRMLTACDRPAAAVPGVGLLPPISSSARRRS